MLETRTDATDDAGWQARLELEIARVGPSSRIVKRRHEGPSCVQRAFYPEGGQVPHVYLLHPPGGLVAGDRLHLHARICTRASALFTTPAAQKLYRSNGRVSRQLVRLRVDDFATLEWLPGETIAFSGARARSETRVELGRDAGFVGWEILCLGRPAAREVFESGSVFTVFEISRAGQLLVVERSDLFGPELSREPWGLAGRTVLANLYCVPREGEPLSGVESELRERLDALGELAAVTLLDSVLVVRVMAHRVESARAVLVEAWRTLRPRWSGREAVAPRIWST